MVFRIAALQSALGRQLRIAIGLEVSLVLLSIIAYAGPLIAVAHLDWLLAKSRPIPTSPMVLALAIVAGGYGAHRVMKYLGEKIDENLEDFQSLILGASIPLNREAKEARATYDNARKTGAAAVLSFFLLLVLLWTEYMVTFAVFSALILILILETLFSRQVPGRSSWPRAKQMRFLLTVGVLLPILLVASKDPIVSANLGQYIAVFVLGRLLGIRLLTLVSIGTVLNSDQLASLDTEIFRKD